MIRRMRRPSRLLIKASDGLRQAQAERKRSMKSGRGSVHAEPVEAWGGVVQQPARGAVVFAVMLLVGCAAQHPFESAPPSPNRPWKAPDLAHYSAGLAESERARESSAVSIDAHKTYELSEL